MNNGELRGFNLEDTPKKSAMREADRRDIINYKNKKQREIQVKKTKAKVKRVAASLMMAGMIAILSFAKKGYERNKGADYYVKNFEETTSSYDQIGVVDRSNGKEVVITNPVTGKSSYTSLDDAIGSYIKRGHDEGFSDEIIYIVCAKKFGKDAVNDYFKEISKGEINEVLDDGYHMACLEGKGASR